MHIFVHALKHLHISYYRMFVIQSYFCIPMFKQLTKEQAIQKLKHYCAYQERSHSEVREKLFQLKIWKKDQDEIIAYLIENDYLNEERFAISYASGKLRIKHWGRMKIKQGLLTKFIPKKIIQTALYSFEDEEYERIFKQLAERKWKDLDREKDPWQKKAKLMRFLQSRGFEQEMIYSVFESLSHLDNR